MKVTTKLDGNGFKIGTGSSGEISFHVDVDEDDFSSVYVKRELRRGDKVQDCLTYGDDNW